MMQVDLATLRGPELRRLLDTTRERGQAALSYEILQEMAARRERGGKRSAEPRMVALNLSDPLEAQEEPKDDLQDEFREEPTSLAAWNLSPPEAWPEKSHEASHEPGAEAPLHMQTRPPSDPPRRRPGWTALAFTLGVALGLGLGWWLGAIAREPRPPVVAQIAAPAAAALPVAPPPAPVATAATEPKVATEAPPVSPALPAPDVRESPGSSPAAADETSATEAAQDEPTAAKGCVAEPTPADRTICGDPSLQRLQRELRQAYAEALDAHEDRALLRERQLAWKDARDGITDRGQLARLYEARIRKLNAATAEARRGQ
jgi:uncharacterized protein YecT (DUF1311 family)